MFKAYRIAEVRIPIATIYDYNAIILLWSFVNIQVTAKNPDVEELLPIINEGFRNITAKPGKKNMIT